MIDAETDEMTGIMCHTPKAHPRHVYRETIYLGRSPFCAVEIYNLVSNLEKQWPAKSYHFLNNNCTDFAQAFASQLAVPEPFPAWTHGVAKGFLSGVTDGDAS